MAVSCGGGHRCSSDPVLPWLWCRPAAAALIHPLAWEPPYAVGSALERKEKPFLCVLSKIACVLNLSERSFHLLDLLEYGSPVRTHLSQKDFPVGGCPLAPVYHLAGRWRRGDGPCSFQNSALCPLQRFISCHQSTHTTCITSPAVKSPVGPSASFLEEFSSSALLILHSFSCLKSWLF